jgi:hypothetical protein
MKKAAEATIQRGYKCFSLGGAQLQAGSEYAGSMESAHINMTGFGYGNSFSATGFGNGFSNALRARSAPSLPAKPAKAARIRLQRCLPSQPATSNGHPKANPLRSVILHDLAEWLKTDEREMPYIGLRKSRAARQAEAELSAKGFKDDLRKYVGRMDDDRIVEVINDALPNGRLYNGRTLEPPDYGLYAGARVVILIGLRDVRCFCASPSRRSGAFLQPAFLEMLDCLINMNPMMLRPLEYRKRGSRKVRVAERANRDAD